MAPFFQAIRHCLAEIVGLAVVGVFYIEIEVYVERFQRIADGV